MNKINEKRIQAIDKCLKELSDWYVERPAEDIFAEGIYARIESAMGTLQSLRGFLVSECSYEQEDTINKLTRLVAGFPESKREDLLKTIKSLKLLS